MPKLKLRLKRLLRQRLPLKSNQCCKANHSNYTLLNPECCMTLGIFLSLLRLKGERRVVRIIGGIGGIRALGVIRVIGVLGILGVIRES